MRFSIFSSVAIAVTATLVATPSNTNAAQPATEIHWKELVPQVQPVTKPKPFFAGAKPLMDDGSPAPPPKPEGRWMSTPAAKAGALAPIVAELDGKYVSIGGYVVPLDFDATKVKEFLLVPFVGACIHVPPPPANQIIYVKIDKGFDVAGAFDPVTVTGKLTASQTFTGLAEAGYSIEADSVVNRKE